MNSPRSQFRLPQELLDKIKTLSRESGIPASEIIRACIVRALPYVEDKIKQSST